MACIIIHENASMTKKQKRIKYAHTLRPWIMHIHLCSQEENKKHPTVQDKLQLPVNNLMSIFNFEKLNVLSCCFKRNRPSNFMGKEPSMETQFLMAFCSRLPIWIWLSWGDQVDSENADTGITSWRSLKIFWTKTA